MTTDMVVVALTDMVLVSLLVAGLMLMGPGTAIAQDYGTGYLNDLAEGLLAGRLQAEGQYDALERLERDRFLREQRRYQWQQLEYQRQYLEQLRRFNEEYQRRGR